VRNTLELVVDDQLRDELDEAEHVDGLSQSRDDERVPPSVSPVSSATKRRSDQASIHDSLVEHCGTSAASDRSKVFWRDSQE
jgi:hypothetical protein